MTIERITVDRALAALEAAVEEQGADYTYDGFDDGDPRAAACLYVYDGAPSCLVGNALHRLGVPLDALADVEMETIDLVAHRVDWPLDDAAVDVLYAAQAEQDQGLSWGAALVAAHREAVES